MNWKAVYSEAEQLLVDRIKVDTANPPGNEIEAARVLGHYFDRALST